MEKTKSSFFVISKTFKELKFKPNHKGTHNLIKKIGKINIKMNKKKKNKYKE